MKQLTIITSLHSQQLKDFAQNAEALGQLSLNKTGWIGKQFSINFQHNSSQYFVEGIINLLTNIAINENPIYKNSPKLQNMAHDLRSTGVYVNLQKALIHFLKQNRNLHLEGYVNFRMSEYREKLDMMSYSLIKKIKLSHED